jgi:hypothetical protein
MKKKLILCIVSVLFVMNALGPTVSAWPPDYKIGSISGYVYTDPGDAIGNADLEHIEIGQGAVNPQWEYESPDHWEMTWDTSTYGNVIDLCVSVDIIDDCTPEDPQDIHYDISYKVEDLGTSTMIVDEDIDSGELEFDGSEDESYYLGEENWDINGGDNLHVYLHIHIEGDGFGATHDTWGEIHVD